MSSPVTRSSTRRRRGDAANENAPAPTPPPDVDDDPFSFNLGDFLIEVSRRELEVDRTELGGREF